MEDGRITGSVLVGDGREEGMVVKHGLGREIDGENDKGMSCHGDAQEPVAVGCETEEDGMIDIRRRMEFESPCKMENNVGKILNLKW
ncbi:hypothetical protein M0R45_025191 [Rubus argutus]|uniref:Uncharacterized protein n=1 Tax=Rubus argutus TaxID=59490 RepID=A0AAW1WWA8_RUBAR